jgi:hypothetical protein
VNSGKRGALLREGRSAALILLFPVTLRQLDRISVVNSPFIRSDEPKTIFGFSSNRQTSRMNHPAIIASIEIFVISFTRPIGARQTVPAH